MSKQTSSTQLKSPKVTVNSEGFLKLLRATFKGEQNAIKKGGHFERKAILLTGAPGAAKTATVKAWHNELNAQYKAEGKKGVRLCTLRLTQCEITDLKGVPVYIEVDGKTQCSFASPSLFPIEGMPNSADGYDMTIIFFDELQQAIPQMQQLAAAVLDGTIGDQQLDMSRSYIVACSNRVEDNATVYPLPMNLSNRLMHVEMDLDHEHWFTWAKNAGINATILGFLANSLSYLNEPTPMSSTQNTAFATPRTWTKLSQTLNAIEEELGDSWVRHPDQRHIDTVVKGTVGHAAGSQLLATAKNIRESINVNDIEAGNDPALPDKPDVQFAVVYELISRADNYLKEVNSINGADKEKISKVLDSIDPKDLKKLENGILWIDKKVHSEDKKMNKSMAALYRGKHTSPSVKVALQLLGKKNPKIAKSLELQVEIYKQYGS